MKKSLFILLLVFVALAFAAVTFLLIRQFGWEMIYDKAKKVCEKAEQAKTA